MNLTVIFFKRILIFLVYKPIIMRNLFVIDLKYIHILRNDYAYCVFYNSSNMKIESYYTEEDVCTISSVEVPKISISKC